MKPLKVLIDRDLEPEDLSEDCLVLGLRKDPSRIILPAAFARETCLPATKKKEELSCDISKI